MGVQECRPASSERHFLYRNYQQANHSIIWGDGEVRAITKPGKAIAESSGELPFKSEMSL